MLRNTKKEAVKLRRQGLSYKEIGNKIGVSKSTLSYWLKSVALKEAYRKRLYTKQIQVLSSGPQSQKLRREREVAVIVKASRKEIKLPLTQEMIRLIGAALYWAEGSKTNMFKFTNSDPVMIAFFVKWIEKTFNISATTLRARLNIYPQQNEHEIKRFWSSLTKIPLTNFGKSYIKPLSKNYKKNNLYYGTMRIEVPRGTDIRIRVFGWIDAICRNLCPEIEKVTKKWQSLKETPRPVNL